MIDSRVEKRLDGRCEMVRRKKFLVAGITILALLMLSYIGLQVWLARSPLVVLGGQGPGGEIFDQRTAVGRVFADVQECGEQQKNLYQCIEVYKEKHGRLPEDMNALISDVHEAMSFDDCPADLTWYVVHFENFGNPKAILIEEHENKHPTAFKLWARGIKPRVQTMGDGTIHLFNDGKLATIDAAKKK
jgi:hypothetical protein